MTREVQISSASRGCSGNAGEGAALDNLRSYTQVNHAGRKELSGRNRRHFIVRHKFGQTDVDRGNHVDRSTRQLPRARILTSHAEQPNVKWQSQVTGMAEKNEKDTKGKIWSRRGSLSYSRLARAR